MDLGGCGYFDGGGRIKWLGFWINFRKWNLDLWLNKDILLKDFE